tara:strand:+ start:494 stop:2689 length:2196 start_codon:yes stop_codon:yes gene_type:complete
MSKKYLLALSLVFCFFYSKAGHEEGGVIITYKSLADVTGDSLEYEITVYSVYSLLGVSAPTSLNISLTSSCFPNSNISLARVNSSTGGLLPLLGADYCAPSLNVSANSGLGLYRTTIILPGKCADFRFSLSSGFGRYNFTANMASSFGTNYFFITLNNLHGPNSSPQVDQADILQAACLLKPLSLYGFIEADGDSVVYSPSTPLNISGTSISAISYNLGYNQQNPVNSPTGYNLDSSTGVVTTSLNTIGAFAIGIKFVEYRMDTALGVRVEIAKGRYIMNLIGASSCSPLPIKIDYPSTANSDSLDCSEKFIQIKTTRRAEVSSLTANGSEFNINSKRNPSLSIVAAQFLSDTIIEIELNQGISANDSISLSISDGTDTNTIYSICGKEVAQNSDTLTFYSTQLSPLNANFSFTSNLLNANFQTSLADSIRWNFGDGSAILINSTNPNHIYSSPGTYIVQLEKFDICGGSFSTSQSITICDSIVAALSYSVSGDTLFFDAQSSFGANNFHWDFGDGDSSLVANGKHVFTNGGTFNVLLTVENDCGDTSQISIVVETCLAPSAFWTYTIVSTTQNGMNVNFDGTASSNATKYVWDFGDGSPKDSSSLSPSHIYTTPSLSYLVSLTIYNACSDKSQKSYRLDEIGLKEIDFISSFELFPNPASESLNLSWTNDFKEEIELNLFSSDGKLLLNQKISKLNNEITLDVSNIPIGLYSLEVLSSSGGFHRKVLIQR